MRGERNNTVTMWRDMRKAGREKREGGDSFCGGEYIGKGGREQDEKGGRK